MGTASAHTNIDIVDHDEVRQRLTDPSVAIIDVLPPVAYEHAHIPGALNLPLAHVLEHAHHVLPDTDQEIVLYCASFS